MLTGGLLCAFSQRIRESRTALPSAITGSAGNGSRLGTAGDSGVRARTRARLLNISAAYAWSERRSRALTRRSIERLRAGCGHFHPAFLF